MNNETFMKELPKCTIYYKEGIINKYNDMAEFIVDSGNECLKLNPNIKCITPDYCFVEYLDGEYKEKNIRKRYSQAVETKGIENDNIKFRDLEHVQAICIYHKGTYDNLGKSYSIIMDYIEKNGYEIIDYYRECYIDGVWNKDKVEDWLTEIEVLVKKKMLLGSSSGAEFKKNDEFSKGILYNYIISMYGRVRKFYEKKNV